MYKATFAGHALHPQLVLLPGGLLPFSFAMDVMNAATGDRKYADAARLAMWGGLLGGLAAGAAGAVDYYSLPKGTAVKRTGNLHASMNISIMALYAANLAGRRAQDRKVDTGSFLMSAVGTAALLVSAWYGAKMSYEQGVRVKGVDPLAQVPELKPPGDEAIKQAFDKLEAAVAPKLPSIGGDNTPATLLPQHY